MPEFILDTGDAYTADRFAKLDYFTQGYITALFFTNSGETDDPLECATVEALAPETWDQIILDCVSFQQKNDGLLESAYAQHAYDSERAGIDLWLTRCGHGVGFWDRRLGDLGDKLTESASALGNLDPYIGDDGRVYLA